MLDLSLSGCHLSLSLGPLLTQVVPTALKLSLHSGKVTSGAPRSPEEGKMPLRH
jgi:hypothetical protein